MSSILVIWDVQHGSSAYLRTPLGKHIVFDLGNGSYERGDKNFSPIEQLYNSWGVKSLDGLILTHPHGDHLSDIHNFIFRYHKIGAAPALFYPKSLSEKAVREANFNGGGDDIKMYLSLLREYTSSVAVEDTAYHAPNNGGVEFKLYFPSSGAESNVNNHSIVTVLNYHGVKILFPGDNEPLSWNELLKTGDFEQAIKGTHILIAPHHGRESGYCKELFEVISPNLVVISDGKFCDTSATTRYSAKAQGWNVINSTGDTKEKKCVTTRDNGVIKIESGINQQSQRQYLEVKVNHF